MSDTVVVRHTRLPVPFLETRPFSSCFYPLTLVPHPGIPSAGKEQRVKTLYTGHATIGTHDVYSFIYADTLLQAEEYLTNLLTRYLRDHHIPSLHALPQVKVVSRPEGWDPPDGYYLPPTSTQYALRYQAHQQTPISQPSSVVQPDTLQPQPDVPQQSVPLPPPNAVSH